MKNKIFRKLGIHGDDNSDRMEEEIISMVNEGHEQGVLHETEAEMITNIFEFGDKEAKDIMTNRSNIVAIDQNTSLADALDYMLNESKSRFPVYDENIDHIVGILHFRDAMRAHRTESNLSLPVGEIEGLLRKAMFVPETKNIADLFRIMQKTKTQMVIVVDEYGQTSGVVAMEDVLEEIVGNIEDEHDEEELLIRRNSDGSYTMDGLADMEDVVETLDIPVEEDSFDTLNGFLISLLGKIPADGETARICAYGYIFSVQRIEDKMIREVAITKDTENAKEPADDLP